MEQAIRNFLLILNALTQANRACCKKCCNFQPALFLLAIVPRITIAFANVSTVCAKADQGRSSGRVFQKIDPQRRVLLGVEHEKAIRSLKPSFIKTAANARSEPKVRNSASCVNDSKAQIAEIDVLNDGPSLSFVDDPDAAMQRSKFRRSIANELTAVAMLNCETSETSLFHVVVL